MSPPDGERRYISSRVDPDALNRLLDKIDTDWRCWVDRCIGVLVDGKPAWVNLDQWDRFIDEDMRACGAIE